MHIKFQAIPIRFDPPNMTKITAHSDFAIVDRFEQLSYASPIGIKVDANLLEYSHKTYMHSNYLIKVI
jgi:hypothetical protein